MAIKPNDRQRREEDPIKEDPSRPRRGSQDETNRHSEGPADPHDDESESSDDDR